MKHQEMTPRFDFCFSGPERIPASAALGRAAATIRIFPAPLPGGRPQDTRSHAAAAEFSGLVSAAVRQDRDLGSPCGSRTDLCKNK